MHTVHVRKRRATRKRSREQRNLPRLTQARGRERIPGKASVRAMRAEISESGRITGEQAYVQVVSVVASRAIPVAIIDRATAEPQHGRAEQQPGVKLVGQRAVTGAQLGTQAGMTRVGFLLVARRMTTGQKSPGGLGRKVVTWC